MEKTSLKLRVRPAIQADARLLAALIHNPAHFHRHLDWHAPLDWLGFPPFFVAEREAQIVAALACPPDPPRAYWLRFFAHAASLPLDQAWEALWEAVRAALEETGAEGVVAAIALQTWLARTLEASQFHLRQHIVTLEHAAPFPVAERPDFPPIREMTATDLEAVAELDALAFEFLWRNSVDTLQRAFVQAGMATVIEEAGQMIAYQISTRNPYGWHLARLAVHPQRQRQGLGRMLVADLLRRAAEHGIARLTVNTQDDNLASLHLYQTLGFHYSGERYPVYEYRLGERRANDLA